jgi:hypothetical protein
MRWGRATARGVNSALKWRDLPASTKTRDCGAGGQSPHAVPLRFMRPLINQEFRNGSIRHVIGSEACGRRPMTLAARHFPGCPLILKRLLGSALG